MESFENLNPGGLGWTLVFLEGLHSLIKGQK